MNVQGNTYTFIYSTILVVFVASLLSVAAITLKPFQVKNFEVEKMQSILQSVKVEIKKEDVEDSFGRYIKDSYVINVRGEKVEGEKAFDINLNKELAKASDERFFPVYECLLEDGSKKYILEVRGKGLWGPIWGFVSMNEDGRRVYGVTFDHKSETPGLGAEITENFFLEQFEEKYIFDKKGDFTGISVVKGGRDDVHSVDAISGGTITSVGVQDMLMDCLMSYKTFLEGLN